jgi:iron complex outermembrane receptor protein
MSSRKLKYLPLSLICSSVISLQIVTQSATAAVLEEVIVTAQKRTQVLQDVSLPVTAISMNRIETNHVITLEDLQFIAPSLSFGNALGVAKIYLRGIGLNDQTSGIDPSVALHVDGAVINDPHAHFTSLFDMERVEVLRGPQGILYGRNATGGSVNLITAKPTHELEGYGRFTYGDYNQVVAEGAISGPLFDRVSGRVAFRGNWRDGYGMNIATGNDVDDANQIGVRTHLNFDVSNDISLLVTGEYYQEDDAALGSKFRRATFPQYATDPTLTPAEAASLAPLGIGGYPTGRNYASEYDPINEKETWAITGTVNWLINDNFSVVNITNYREVDVFFAHDFDGSSVVNRYDLTGQPPTIHSRTQDSEQFSNEFQINYTSDRLTGLAAFYWFEQDIDATNRSGLSPFGGLPVPGLTRQRVFLTGQGTTESWSIFANLTYALTEEFALKLGARYTEEERTIDNENFIQVFRNPPFVPGVPTPLDTDAPFALPPFVVDRFGVPVGTRGNFPIRTALADSVSTDNFSPMIGLEWRPSDDLMMYYTYSEGFKSAVGQLAQSDSGIANPETVQNHEFGAKTSWLDNSLILNLAIFSYEMQDLQLARTLPAGGGGTGFVNLFENAAEMEGMGVELEMYWQPTDQLSLTAGFSVLDVNFVTYETVDNFDPCLVLASCTAEVKSYAGNSPRYTPDIAFNIHGEYDIPMNVNGTVTFAADVSQKSKQFFSEANNDVERSDAYTFWDASVRWTSADDHWHASLWGKNLTDEFALAGNFTVSLSRTVGALYLPPRTYGVTVGYRF